MTQFVRLLLISMIIFIPGLNSSQAQAVPQDFGPWLQDLRNEALAAGITKKTLDRALKGIKNPLPRVLELDRNQPEFKQSTQEYLAARVNSKRVAAGKVMLRRYPTWLGRVEDRYQVQRSFILALWGIETGYGRHSGSFSVIEALATLAHDGRRADYFRGELLNALRILDARHIRLKRMKGSWAGAMGQCQFMPSAFLKHAVDADGDKHINIWGSVPDVFASTANYLAQAGWQPEQGWGEAVTLPPDFDASLAGLDTRQTVERWHSLGVMRPDGKAFSTPQLEASLILPDGDKGPAYLVYDNFRVLRKWNRSNAFAIAVGTLADRISR
ncbi:lytic murein transglycosylase [Geopsychrobacter electrodiphilus]|uniref:lytic murein transglycosylase n=1 Tax=Geopsychrobacter electrodiphilus TaxID=225196 RepID=UPI00037C7A68|nr:lytic murein transglycosylase [Geopsychrobacter electrodiphilus]